ncbi:MFS transporter [Streptomyces sp. B6B3]|uniref:MFS transporter n=1 Tax=Streptomyces sp. B6B3 TaxID=3153570 RepID=UPI00325E8124
MADQPTVSTVDAVPTAPPTAPPAAATPAAARDASPGPAPAPAIRAGAVGRLGPLGPLGLVTILLCQSLLMIDVFVVNVALPSIDRELATGPALLELVVAGYALALAVLLVLGGRLGDTFGRRRLLLVGVAGFGLASLACGLAPNAWTLVAGRVAQGAAAALVQPQVLGTIQGATEGQRRARALGLVGATAGLSMTAGQVIGGVLVAADLAGLGWRAVFMINVPVVLVALALVARFVPETRAARPTPIDVPGTVLLGVTLVALLLPLTEGQAAGWPLWTWLSLAAVPLAGGAFLAVERRAERTGRTVPLVPPALLRLPGMRRGLPALAACVGGFGGFMFVMALAFQQGLDFGPVRAGTALVPYALAFFAASLAGPRLTTRLGARVLTWGGVIQAVGVALLVATVLRGWPELGATELAPALLVAGFGQGMQLPVYFRIVLAEVPQERAGVGSGVMATVQQSAMALGVALLGALFLTVAPGSGMRDALAVALTAQLVAVLATTTLSLRVSMEGK